MNLSLSILSHLGNVERHAKLQGAMLHALRELAKQRRDKALEDAISEIQGEQVSLISEVNWINADIDVGKAVGEIQKADVGSQGLELHPANWSAPGHGRALPMARLQEPQRTSGEPQRAPTVEELELMQRTLKRVGDDTELGLKGEHREGDHTQDMREGGR